tara:strand:+ start:523 stop:843 length:321 start_codon:yes stop_codon:yes gene_type:complete
MIQELEQFFPLILVAGGIWLLLKYLRAKKGITNKDDGSDEIQKATLKTGKAINKSLLANKKLIKIGAGIILCIIIYQYLSPYHSCKRDMKRDGAGTYRIESVCGGK